MTDRIKLFGTEFDRFIDCPKCKAKLACEFGQYGYNTPCSDCKLKADYDSSPSGWGKKGTGYGRNEITGVFTGHGRNFYTNRNGDIVKDEPYKPLKTGK